MGNCHDLHFELNMVITLAMIQSSFSQSSHTTLLIGCIGVQRPQLQQIQILAIFFIPFCSKFWEVTFT